MRGRERERELSASVLCFWACIFKALGELAFPSVAFCKREKRLSLRNDAALAEDFHRRRLAAEWRAAAASSLRASSGTNMEAGHTHMQGGR